MRQGLGRLAWWLIHGRLESPRRRNARRLTSTGPELDFEPRERQLDDVRCAKGEESPKNESNGTEIWVLEGVWALAGNDTVKLPHYEARLWFTTRQIELYDTATGKDMERR